MNHAQKTKVVMQLLVWSAPSLWRVWNAINSQPPNIKSLIIMIARLRLDPSSKAKEWVSRLMRLFAD